MTHCPRGFTLSLVLLLGCSLPATAADKNGVSLNAISLPKGPGSIEGLGESFQPSLNTGTAKYGLGISVPPGVAGHQPRLVLSYEGGGGNGPLGYGWNLSLPCIQRRTDKGIPTYGQDLGVLRADTFINESREELVPLTNGFYFCENEESFVRYRQFNHSWEGTLPNGTRLEFGLSASGRIENPANAQVFCWLLERETDTRGNVIEYVYRSFPGEENANQKYLALVRYGPGAAPWTHFHFLTLDYEERPDWFEDCRPGFPVRTGRRLKSMIVGTQGVDLPGHLPGDYSGDNTLDHLNRRYDLEYSRYAGTNSHWSLLAGVTVVGADGVSSLPPETFDYAVSNPPDTVSAEQAVWGGIEEPIAVLDNELVELIDLNADGLPDLLKTESGGGAHTVAVNQGPVQETGGWSIRWAAPVAVDPGGGAAWNFDLGSERTHLADMDGDGLADLVHQSADEVVFYFRNSGGLTWGSRQEMALAGSVPPAPFGNNGVRTADVDFDKRMDVIQSLDLGGGIAYRTWFNLGDKAYSLPVTVESQGGFDFGTPGVQIADGNGDRVPDVARIRPGAVLLAAGFGHGRFAEPRSMVLPDYTLDDLQIEKARLADINGDGLADLVLERAAPGECWYWLNLGNYTLSVRKRVVDLPATISDQATVRWADLNGNGTTDLIYSDSQGTPRLRMIELGDLVSGGLAPNLLIRIDNGIGRVTQLEYAPSTRFALEDASAGKPWPDAVPFPVTVVAGVSVADSLGHEYVTRFRYHEGYYDPIEKQFRGFAQVEQVDLGDPAAPTLLSRSRFDTGRDFDAMKGRLLVSSAETEQGGVFWEETTTWASPPRILMEGTNGVPIRFAHPVSSVKRILELDQGSARRIESEFDYDDHGNQTRLAHFGIVEADDRAAFDDERITITEYAINTDAWIVRLPRHQSIQDENHAVLSRAEFYYDDETFSGGNPGLVTRGNLTLRRDWIDPSDPAAYVSSSRTRYDDYGNPIAQFDPLHDGTGDASQGHFRELTYDDAFHSYPIRETIHLGEGKPDLVYEADYDEGWSSARSSTDFNGNTTTYQYDALARLVSIIKPQDTEAFPTTEYDYVLASATEYQGTNGLVVSTGRVNYVETRQLDRRPGEAGTKLGHYLISRRFVDGLGRALMTRSEAEPAPGEQTPRVVVTGAVQFNARQGSSRVLNPFFTLRTGSLAEQLAYEPIEVPGWSGQFHVNGGLVALDLGGSHKTQTEYDALLRTVRATNPDGTSSRTDYEPLVIRFSDENDTDAASPHFETPLVQTTDGLGRLVRVEERARLNDDGTPSGDVHAWTTRYEYDLNDRLTRVIDSQNNVKILRYDGLMRKTLMNDPDSGVSTYLFDDASNLIETVDAKSQRIRYTYDGANRILTEDYQDETSSEFSYYRSPDVVYHYDQPAAVSGPGGGILETARNTRGALAYVEDTIGEEHTSYDPRGRVEWTVKRIPDFSIQGGPWIAFRSAFEYDSFDRITRLTYPDHDEIALHYNDRGMLERISGGPSSNILSEVAYLPSAHRNHIRYGNGVETRHGYDSRLRLTLLLAKQAERGTELIHFGYDHDGVSNIKTIHDHRDGSVIGPEDKRRNTQEFTFDDLYRLTRVQYNRPNPSPENSGEIQYRYDRIGNLLAQASGWTNQIERRLPLADLGELDYGGVSGRSNRIGRQPSDPPGPHALTTIRHPRFATRQYPYDANGNLLSIEGMTCTWDFKNRLVAVEDETMRAEYRYDFADRRTLKRVLSKSAPSEAGEGHPDQIATTLYVGKHFEVRDREQPTKYVFYGGNRVARITGSLSASNRLQRFRLHRGWNLVSLAVTATNLAAQFHPGSPDPFSGIESMYRWNEVTRDYTPVTVGDDVPAGAVLWIKSVTNAWFSILGGYADPVSRQVPAKGAYLAGAGLETWSPSLSLMMAAWHYAAGTRQWHSRFGGDLTFLGDRPRTLAPGEAWYVDTDSPVEFAPPDPSLRICYYHHDHLGSSSVITDADGRMVEETAFYPFGEARHEYRLRNVDEAYQFTQKETDRESGLQYFEARYLAGALSRFMTPDPKFANPDLLSADELTGYLVKPQKGNLYAYVLNNPVSYHDPTGLDAKEKIEEASSIGGFVSDVANFKGPGFVFNAVGVGIKTKDFIDDPTEHNAAQAIWEAEKWAVTAVALPVGLIFQALDLTGYGPSSIFENIEKSTQAKRQSIRYLKEATQTYRATTKMINEAVPKIQAQHRQAAEGVKQLHQKAADIREQNRQELERVNRDISKAEAKLARQQAELNYWRAQERKAKQ